MAYSGHLSLATDQLISFAGWFFLGHAVSWLQSIYYSLTIRAGSRKPTPGSPQYLAHRRAIHISVVVLYLLYTIYEADWQLQRTGDFYRLLSIPLDADERTIQSRFRRLAAQFHPDKLPPTVTPAASATATAHFMRLQLARDALVSGPRRFAYDRFGPDVLMPRWSHCLTVHDFVSHGFLHLYLPFYLSTAAFMFLANLAGYMTWGRYWRWLAFASMAAFEGRVISAPELPFVVARVLNPIFRVLGHPPYLPFQAVVVARKVLVAVFVALQQVAPLLRPPMKTQMSEAERLRLLVERQEMLVMGAHMKVGKLLEEELRPFMGDGEALVELQAKLEERHVRNAIEEDGEVRAAVERARAGTRGYANGSLAHGELQVPLEVDSPGIQPVDQGHLG
ncbi:hypothetical protein H2201_008056 [Coniosporium apollinis]|uniref:J domain-containing protein n=1 Tax=Coniosporium apollinis TaxID=61459 RepID=A0ABQ9NK04_9PEZI|nr:hypothetical protein H2201_008056 [Coniosporium apollinis]